MRLTVLAATAALLLGSGAIAEAQWNRQAISGCRPQSAGDRASYILHGIGAANCSSSQSITLVCPSIDTSVQPDSQVSEVRVYGNDWSTTAGFTARACRTSRDGTDHVCGDAVSSGAAFTGHTVLTLSPANIWSSIDFGYLEITVPRVDDNVCSILIGWLAQH
jgi:hypothetical protein